LKNHSPLNFIILGDIIEKIYKNFKGITKTFDEIIREYIFEPLKMNNTYYNIEKIDKLKGKSYKEISTSFLNANSGFVSNLEDLTKFYKAIHNKSSLLLPSKSFNGQDDPYEG
jgi:CubicO group peptidase (beta-lactamase class C family)